MRKQLVGAGVGPAEPVVEDFSVPVEESPAPIAEPPPRAEALPPPAPEPLPMQPAPVLRTAPRRKKKNEADDPPLRPDWVISAAVIITSLGLISAVVPGLAILVLPLAGLGLVAAVYALTQTLRSGTSINYSAAAGAYGFLVLAVAAAFPGCLGPRYHEYRQPRVDPDVTRVIPREGQPATGLPRDPDWVDASKYALQRKGLLVEVVGVRVGAAKVVEGARVGSEECTLVHLRLRNSGDLRQFDQNNSAPPERGVEYDVTLTDAAGRPLTRRMLDSANAVPSATRGSAMFPVSTTDLVVAFTAPPADADGMRLEVSGGPLDGKPLRFTIPKSMITRAARAGR